MLFKFKSCGKCGGDLRLDEDEWCCFQCGTVYYPQNPVEDISQDTRPVLQTVDCGSHGNSTSRPIRTEIIRPPMHSGHHLLDINQALIDLCNEGRSVQEISEIVGKSRRQIRDVKSHLRRTARKREPQLELAK